MKYNENNEEQPSANVNNTPSRAMPNITPLASTNGIPSALTGAAALTFPDLFFDHHLNRYWIKTPSRFWIKLERDDVFDHLAKRIHPDLVGDVIVATQEYHAVSFAGALGGYTEGLVVQGDTRILVISSPKFIAPKPGNWDMLRRILERMFGDVQLPYVYGWIKVSLEMFAAKEWMAGQALVLCGPVESGKNLFGLVLEKLFGGRKPGKPYSYMTQKTDFNSDFSGCELLTIEDEVSHVKIQDRRAFGAKIKDLAVNESRRLHRKHAEALTVIPLQRILISLNDEPERLLVLPPIEPDIEDKIMLLKVFKHPMPMPTNTAAAKTAFSAALLAQLPAFVDFLQSWKIPAELVANRFGITHFHHPEILAALNEYSPEDQLLQLIDETIFLDEAKTNWHGKASKLDRELKSAVSDHVRREAAILLPAVSSCGRYLGRLATRYPNRVIKHPGSGGIHNWTITPPETGGNNGGGRRRSHATSQLSPEALKWIQVKLKALPIKSSESENGGGECLPS
jgi:hypothetical protein